MRRGIQSPPAGVAVFLSVPEVAAYLRCSRTTVYKLLAEGRLRSIKLGRLRRIPAGELARLVGFPERADADRGR
jgi:excisionase family DNA binding protein